MKTASINPLGTAKEIATKTLKTAGATALISLGSDAVKGQEAKKDTFDGRSANTKELSQKEANSNKRITKNGVTKKQSDAEQKNGANYVSSSKESEPNNIALDTTIDNIAKEVQQYGLLTTQESKEELKTKIQTLLNDPEIRGTKYSNSLDDFFLSGLQWLQKPQQDKHFTDQNNTYSRKRLVEALIKSPDFGESFGSLSSLAKGQTTVKEITDHNEYLIQLDSEAKTQSKLAQTSRD